MSVKGLKLRPSKMPAFMACPSFCMKETAPKTKSNIKAEVGTCCHKIFEDIVSHGITPSYEQIKRYADDFGLPMEGYDGVNRKASVMAKKWEKHAAKFFPNPGREKFRSYTLSNGVVVEGTCDLDQIHADMACVLDLKTGETMTLDAMIQIMTYALLLWREYSILGVNHVYGFCFNTALDYYKIEMWDAERLIAFEREIEDKSEQIGKVFNTGAQCTYCPNLLDCPAHINAVRSLLPITSESLDVVKRLDAESIGRIRPNIKFLEAAIKAYKEAEKAFVMQTGSVMLPDGTVLKVKEEQRKKWVFKEVKKELDAYRGEIDISKYLDITAENIEDIIGDTAEKGMKGKDKKEFMEILLANEEAYKITSFPKIEQKIFIPEEITDGTID